MAGFKLAFGFFSDILLPMLNLMIEERCGSDKVTNRPGGWWSGAPSREPRAAQALLRGFRPVAAVHSLDAAFSAHLCWTFIAEDNLKAFRRLLQRTPVYGVYKALGHYPDYWYWILRGRPTRSPHLLKQKTVREYGERYGLKTLVETGTYYGEMVAAMRNHFDHIYSIEYVPELAQRAARKFGRYPHIRIFCGDSRVVMPDILALLEGPALFWLDAGYYGWVGMQGDQQRLSAELEMILSQPYPHIILLDDARGLTGQQGIPSVAKVKAYVESTFPQRQVEVRFDIMRITRRG